MLEVHILIVVNGVYTPTYITGGAPPWISYWLTGRPWQLHQKWPSEIWIFTRSTHPSEGFIHWPSKNMWFSQANLWMYPAKITVTKITKTPILARWRHVEARRNGAYPGLLELMIYPDFWLDQELTSPRSLVGNCVFSNDRSEFRWYQQKMTFTRNMWIQTRFYSWDGNEWCHTISSWIV